MSIWKLEKSDRAKDAARRQMRARVRSGVSAGGPGDTGDAALAGAHGLILAICLCGLGLGLELVRTDRHSRRGAGQDPADRTSEDHSAAGDGQGGRASRRERPACQGRRRADRTRSGRGGRGRGGLDERFRGLTRPSAAPLGRRSGAMEEHAPARPRRSLGRGTFRRRSESAKTVFSKAILDNCGALSKATTRRSRRKRTRNSGSKARLRPSRC